MVLVAGRGSFLVYSVFFFRRLLHQETVHDFFISARATAVAGATTSRRRYDKKRKRRARERTKEIEAHEIGQIASGREKERMRGKQRESERERESRNNNAKKSTAVLGRRLRDGPFHSNWKIKNQIRIRARSSGVR